MIHLGRNIKRIINETKAKFNFDKTVYLTFDDGPSQYTNDLLSVLKKHNVKATFFVTEQAPEYEYLIKKEMDEGHTIGAHTYNHVYSEVYANEEAYFSDLEKIQEVIKRQTGQETKYIRFPGGASNRVSAKYQKGIMTTLTNEVTELGYKYFDWNACGDDSFQENPRKVLKTSKKQILSTNPAIILFHDTKPTTPKVIDKLISWGLRYRCRFLPIDDDAPVIHHRIVNK